MKWYHPWNRLSLRETIVLLKYHAESPSKEHGGFDERTVGMSVAALRHISELRSCLKEAIAATDIRNLKRLEWMTVVSTKKPRRISVKPNTEGLRSPDRPRAGDKQHPLVGGQT